MKMKANQAMVECLKAEGVSVVFGYPGAAICPLYDALLDSDIKHILVRHEANGGHAANGYARITHKPAVAIATSGPGATNLITAIATAYADSVPMVCITGQVIREQIGSDAFQEADITGAAEPFVKHSFLVKNSQDIPKVFKEAFYIAGSGRPGPVLIDVPMDVQLEEIDFEYPQTVDIRGYKPTIKGNFNQIRRVSSALEEAQRPVICVGGGVESAGANGLIIKLAEKIGCPIVSTMMGMSIVPCQHELFFGMLGMHGVKAANFAIHHADTVMLVGARVGDRSVKTPVKVENNATVIHIDIDPAEIGKNMTADIPLVGDAKNVLEQLIQEVKPLKHNEWIEILKLKQQKDKPTEIQEGTVNPRRFIKELSEVLPDDVIITADVGQNQIWTATGYNFKQKSRLLTSGGMGTMGYSVPCAIGAKFAAPDKTVCAICGDGSFQMQFMELATAIQFNAPIKIIVMTNNRLGMVRELQTNGYGDRQIGVSLDGSPDFIKLAQAYGIEAFRVQGEQDYAKAFELLAKPNQMCLIECMVAEYTPTIYAE